MPPTFSSSSWFAAASTRLFTPPRFPDVLHSRLSSLSSLSSPLWTSSHQSQHIQPPAHNQILRGLLRTFTTCPTLLSKPLPPRLQIPDADIIENFLKGSGPGGQKINKTSSAVQLKHLPTGIVVKCQETRSRSQNRKIARRILAERVEEHMLGDQSRTAVKQREKSRKKQSAEKKRRRKYRALEEGKRGVDDGDGVEGAGDEVVDGDGNAEADEAHGQDARSIEKRNVGEERSTMR